MLPGSLRIGSVTFKSGPVPGGTPLQVAPGAVLILVGPNNSGKSLALREIDNWAWGDEAQRLVVDHVDIDFPQTPTEAQALLKPFHTQAPQNQGTNAGHIWVSHHTFRSQPHRQFQIHEQSVLNAVQAQNRTEMRGHFMPFYTVRLDGRTRFALSDSKPTGDLQTPPQNHLAALFRDDDSRLAVRALAKDAFGMSFVIDPTGMQSFRIRMSNRDPTTPQEEQALDQAARSFHAAAPMIDRLSDGVQAYVGLTSALLSLPHRVILLDEPEAFLHPPLARKLGTSLARIARDRNASLMVSTHSSDFVLGCIEATTETTVVRLTYEAGQATARVLASADLAELMKNPLLRSTGVLRALFHRSAVIAEADTDRAFYDEINRRLLAAPGRGLPDSLFLNGVGKDVVPRLVSPLRRIGIPAVALVDLDIIRDTGTKWSSFMQACQVDPTARATLAGERDWLKAAIEAVPLPGGGDILKKRGVRVLSGADRTRADAFLSELSKFGLFAVPHGEVESWLHTLGATGHGPSWLADIFSKLGQSEDDATYVAPAADDVWAFVDGIAAWATNPTRLGIGA